MTAKEMFEKIGWDYYNNLYEIRFLKGTMGIYFDKEHKEYECWDLDGEGELKIDMELHQMITKQLKELGWIE